MTKSENNDTLPNAVVTRVDSSNVLQSGTETKLSAKTWFLYKLDAYAMIKLNFICKKKQKFVK